MISSVTASPVVQTRIGTDLAFEVSSSSRRSGVSAGTTAGTVRMRDMAPRVTSVDAPAAGTRKIGDTID